jgi:cytochrome c peroxidase
MLKKLFLTAVLVTSLISPVFMPDAGWAVLASLKTVPVPEPLNLGAYVRDRSAAVQLGKALFWDMQVGSDGVQACGTCHFHAGADNRTRNQLSPGLNGGDSAFGNNLLGLPSPAQVFSPNTNLTRAHFPLHKLTDPDTLGEPLRNAAGVVSDTNDVVSSMGVQLRQFVDIVPGSPVDLSAPLVDDVFNLAGTNIRRVEPRNTPSVINSVFNFANFWDGRANNIFNGNNPFGPADPRNHNIVNVNGNLQTQLLRLRQSSLASQAVGPPNSDFEMSWRGRTWPKIGKKMLSLKPLAQQKVHATDSVLGPMADNATGAGLNTTYEAMIRKAFPGKYWNNTSQIVTFDVNGVPAFSPGTPANTDEYTQMEANFSLFFGIAVQLYEATLIADDSPFDRFMEGSGFQTTQQQRGMDTFLGAGGCLACHAGAETTDVSVLMLQGENPITGVPQPLNRNPLAANEFMSFLTGTGLYDGGFHNSGVRPGGAVDPAAPEFMPENEDIGRGGDTGLDASFENFPLDFGHLGLRNTGFIGPLLPAFLSAYVPPLPFGFRPTDTSPFPGRAANFGSFKTPGLRNVELTGPYMHNGGMSTLHQVVEFYARGGDFPFTNDMDFDPAIFPIGKLIGSDVRKNEVVAFLVSMTDPRVKEKTAPFDHPEIFVPINGRAPVSPTGTRDGFLARPAMFKQISAVGVGGLPAEGLPAIGTFLGLNPFSP